MKALAVVAALAATPAAADDCDTATAVFQNHALLWQAVADILEACEDKDTKECRIVRAAEAELNMQHGIDWLMLAVVAECSAR